MQITLDKLEEKFRKYNVLKRDVHRSSIGKIVIDLPLVRLSEFKQIIWKEAAKKCRQKEHQSFIEWMMKLDQSEKRGTRTTFGALRGVLIEFGIQISRSLIEYLLIMPVFDEREEIATSICEVESIIRCLKVEESSIVVDSFLSAVKLFEKAMKLVDPCLAKPMKIKKEDLSIEKEINVRSVITSLIKDANQKTTDKIGEDNLSQIKKENSVLHLIIIEALRLEVSFCFPALPMMVSNEVYLAMGEHLMDNVFEDRMSSLSAKIDKSKLLEILFVGEKDSMRKSFEQVLDVGVKEIWNDLKLKL